jgi:hypothetical protein
MNPGNGRFTQQDSFAGNEQDPPSLHKYMYAEQNPVSNTDPSGLVSLGDVASAQNIQDALSTMAVNYAGNVAQELAVQYILFGEITTSRLQAALTDATNFMPVAGKKVANTAKAIGSFLKHFRAFIKSPATRKAWKRGNHNIDVDGPSTPYHKTDRIRLGGFKFQMFNFQFFVGGKAGLVFQVFYKIGKHSGPGQGMFLFRFDYMDFRTKPATFGPHIHVKYDGVNINHGLP